LLIREYNKLIKFSTELSAIHSSSDFFPPSAIHQLLLQPENGASMVNSATAAYFCAVAPSSSSSAPADPQPSSIGQMAQKSVKTTGIGSQNGGNNSNKDRKRPYPCTICTSKFGSKMELEEHQNSHTGQKPFQCDVRKRKILINQLNGIILKLMIQRIMK